MGVDIDVIVDADPAHAPLAVFVRLSRQILQRRATISSSNWRRVTPSLRRGLAFVELCHELGERGVDVGETVEDPSPKPAEQPALDDQHGLLDLGLVARLSWPRWQDGGSIMGRHLAVGTIDLRLVEAGLDDGGPRPCGRI
jgi:hypothetical protein